MSDLFDSLIRRALAAVVAVVGGVLAPLASLGVPDEALEDFGAALAALIAVVIYALVSRVFGAPVPESGVVSSSSSSASSSSHSFEESEGAE